MLDYKNYKNLNNKNNKNIDSKDINILNNKNTNILENKNISILETKDYRELKSWKRLSPRHRIFLENYFRCFFNGTRAYLRTYSDCSEESARREASRLLTRVDIQEAIEERLKCDTWFASLTQDDLIRLGFEVWLKADSKTRVRLLELFAKIKGLTKEQATQQVTIFQDVEKDLESVRLRNT